MALAVWLTAAVTLGVAMYAASATDCPNMWVAFDGSCYFFARNISQNYADAKNFCRANEAHLVTVDNAKEGAFLREFLRRLKTEYFWLGLTDETVEGQWLWYDTQSRPNFTDWAQGEPSDSHHHEDCAVFDSRRDYTWNDVLCSNKIEPLCELEYVVRCSETSENRKLE